MLDTLGIHNNPPSSLFITVEWIELPNHISGLSDNSYPSQPDLDHCDTIWRYSAFKFHKDHPKKWYSLVSIFTVCCNSECAIHENCLLPSWHLSTILVYSIPNLVLICYHKLEPASFKYQDKEAVKTIKGKAVLINFSTYMFLKENGDMRVGKLCCFKLTQPRVNFQSLLMSKWSFT